MAPASWRPADEKVILDSVSGAVNPGQFLSIIGASGMLNYTLINN